MNSQTIGKRTRSAAAKDAFEEVVTALSQDMPLIMYGSGDPSPEAANPESVRLLSELTTNYIGNLVEAALDAHAILNDGPQALPPQPFAIREQQAKKIPTPHTQVIKGKKRRRVTDDFFDEPLKEPKIRNNKTSPSKPTTEEESNNKQTDEKERLEQQKVDEWVGVSGVDFWEMSRARKTYVSTPTSIGASSFIFPICHDAGLYGRVLEVQRMTRRSIAPILADPLINFVVREEGGLRKRDTNASGAGEDADPEDSNSEEEEGNGAAWPGLDSILPVHMTTDF